MRYMNQPIISFTDIDGNIIPLREWREIPSYQVGAILQQVSTDMDFSEVITRPEYYNRDYEFLAYALFEANKEAIVDGGWKLDNIRTMNVPVVQQVV
jgi:hypothetical protein